MSEKKGKEILPVCGRSAALAASESGRRHVKSEELVMQSMFLNSFRDHATMEGHRAHGEREEPDADQAGFWKRCRRMKKRKTRRAHSIGGRQTGSETE